MPNTRHTPGPFVVAGDIINEHGNLTGVHIAQRGSGMVGQVFANCLVKTDAKVRANAKLFAASAELLAAAVEALAAINRIKPAGNGNGTQVRLAQAITKATQ